MECEAQKKTKAPSVCLPMCVSVCICEGGEAEQGVAAARCGREARRACACVGGGGVWKSGVHGCVVEE